MKRDLKFGLLLTKLVRYQENLESNAYYIWTLVSIHASVSILGDKFSCFE